MKARIYSVAQIVGYLKETIESDILLNGFFLEAEISNYKKHGAGHLYFTLKDSSAALNAVMFRGFAQALAFEPENGMKVIAYGRVSIYEKTGQAQLYAEMLEPIGKGGLFASYEQLKNKLEKEGLFDAARKRPLPVHPRCVAVVTSPTGAAVRDIITVLRRRNCGVAVVVVPVLVQGAAAGADIARAIRLVNRWGGAEVMIVGRGGGSAEDLWAFNEEIVARAIFESKIPVVSAVGHETDFTIADFTADVRAATPSAAAALVVPDMDELRARVTADVSRLRGVMTRRVTDAKTSLKRVNTALGKSLAAGLSAKRMLFAYTLDGLHKVSPLGVLKRGYALVSDADGAVIQSAARLAPGMAVRLTLDDGMAEATIQTRSMNDAEEKADI